MEAFFGRTGMILVAVTAIAGTTACGDDLLVTVLPETGTASPSDPAQLTVTAVNRGDSRVVWGMGSSSCQLGAVVRLGLRDAEAFIPRACTADLVEQALAPGESRVETLEWAGAVIIGSGPETLPPGLYRVRGAAGSRWVSDPVEVRVVSESPELGASR